MWTFFLKKNFKNIYYYFTILFLWFWHGHIASVFHHALYQVNLFSWNHSLLNHPSNCCYFPRNLMQWTISNSYTSKIFLRESNLWSMNIKWYLTDIARNLKSPQILIVDPSLPKLWSGSDTVIDSLLSPIHFLFAMQCKCTLVRIWHSYLPCCFTESYTTESKLFFLYMSLIHGKRKLPILLCFSSFTPTLNLSNYSIHHLPG